MVGKKQLMEEGQENVHVPLQTCLVIQNTEMELLHIFCQGFVHKEKFYIQ